MKTIWSNHKNSTERVKTFVDEFIRSEHMQNWHSEAVSSDFHIGGRFGRCYDAAEHGADGSTHAEIIDDWRKAFKSWLSDKLRGAWSVNRGDRFSAAVLAYFDSVEQWHIEHETINQEVG